MRLPIKNRLLIVHCAFAWQDEMIDTELSRRELLSEYAPPPRRLAFREACHPASPRPCC
jgi:hypothetical protein